MTITNYQNSGKPEEARNLYKVSYRGNSAQEDAGNHAKVHILAGDLEEAIDMFCGFYSSSHNGVISNPREIKESEELTDHDKKIGRGAIIGIERILNVVLNKTVSTPSRRFVPSR